MDDADKTDSFVDPELLAANAGDESGPETGSDEETQDLPVSDVTEPSIKVLEVPEDPSPEVQSHLNAGLMEKARSIREQRSVIRDRMEKIEASKGRVKENVYQKVATDYLKRLEETRKKMLEVKEEIDSELVALYEKERDAAQRVHTHEETLEEAHFRHELGEHTQEEYESIISKEQELLKTISREQAALQGAITQYEEIFAGEDLAQAEPIPAPKPSEPPPVTAPSAPPSVGTQEPRVASREGAVAPQVTASEVGQQPPPPAVGVILLRENGQITGEYPVENQIYIGRSPTNEIVLQEAKVSRKHAGILKKDEGYLLMDNKSSNGTFVNGRKIAEHMLQPGDMIQIGSYELEFKI